MTAPDPLAEPPKKALADRGPSPFVVCAPRPLFATNAARVKWTCYATYEAAEQPALVIKKGYPIVHVAIYDTVECVNKVIELP